MHGAMLSACADPAPSRSPSSAHAISVSAVDRAADQRIDRHHRRGGAGGAAAEAARQRQPLPDAQADTAALAELREQRQRGDAGGVARRVARQAAVVAVDRLDEDAVRWPARKRAVTSSPGMIEREAEDIEAAADIRHGRRSKGGRGDHCV